MAILLVPNDFSTIQQAFTAAKDGDCILIAGGVYPVGGILNGSNITITTDQTPVTIGSSTTSMETGITIKGDNNLLSNIKVTNFAVGIAIAGNNNQVNSCELLTNQDSGLTLSGCKNCITHTNFFSNVNTGILLTLSSDNSIVENSSLSSCGTGILIAGNGNLLRKNIITLNGIGIKILGDKTTLHSNIIYGNTSIGVVMVGKDQVWDCNTLKNNTTNLITKDISECQLDYDF